MRWLMILALLISTEPVWAQERRALIIGNNDYEEVEKLDKAVADALSLSQTLDVLGFDTHLATDLGRRGMNRQISQFTSRLNPGDIALLFFAGHGVEIDGENYLLPTDIIVPSNGESDFVRSEAIALSDLLDRIRTTGARASIAIIDACRNNPFEVTNGRSIGKTRGLGRIIAPQGTFVIFSAGAGQLALDRLDDDDTAENSVFTRALLPLISQPGLEIRALMSDLRVSVRDLASTVQHRQIPAYYDELIGEFYFAIAPRNQSEGVADFKNSNDIRLDLELTRSIGTVQAYDAFLEKYSDRSDAFAFQVALKLRDSLEDSSPDKTVAAHSPQGKETEIEVLIEQSQVELNRLGCSVGSPDGIAGPRTKTGFRAYLTATGSSLKPSDLGSKKALKELAGKPGPVCVAIPTPERKSIAPTLAGTWSFSATCAAFLKVTGSASYTQAGPNFFRGQISDSLGQTGSAEVYLSGQDISGKSFFPGKTNVFSGRLAPDGNSYTTVGTSTCNVQARRLQ